MTKHSYGITLLAALALALVVVPATAQDDGGMTAPPWGDAGARIHFGDEDQGTLQIQYKGQFRMNVRDIGSGQDGEDVTTNFGFRRNRLAFMGAWSDKVSLYVQTEFTEDLNVDTLGVADANLGSDFQLLDAVVRFNFSPAFKLNVGKFKYNLSRENLEVLRGAAHARPLALHPSAIRDDTQPGCRALGQPVWREGPVPRGRDGGPQGRLGRHGAVFGAPLQRARARDALRPREQLRLQGHLPRQEEGPDDRRGLPTRAQRDVHRHRHTAGRRGLPGLDSGRLLRVPARGCRHGHGLRRLREGGPRRRLPGRKPGSGRDGPVRPEERLVRARAATSSTAFRSRSSAATRSGASPVSTTCSTRSWTGTALERTTTSGGRT